MSAVGSSPSPRPRYVVTGASGGIGRATALGIARRAPGRIALVARRRPALEALAGELRGLGAEPIVLPGDLALQAEVRRVAAAITAELGAVDVLVLNAGAWFHRREETADGIERTWALNVLGTYLMAQELRPALRRAAPSRVIITASEAHRGYHLHLEDPENRHGYRGFRAYGASKLALIELAREMAQRWTADGIAVNSFHPGFIASGFGLNNTGFVRWGMRVLGAVGGRSPEHGAGTAIRLATDPALAGITGAYFRGGRPSRASRAADTPGQSEALWALCDRMTGGAAPGPGLGPSAP